MAGHGKGFREYDWLVGFQMFYLNNVLGISGTNSCPEEYKDHFIEIESIEDRVEDATIKKDLISKLSDDAKEIIKIVLNSPDELIETFLTPKYNVISKDKISMHLRSLGWKNNKIIKTFKEIKIFTKEIDEMY